MRCVVVFFFFALTYRRFVDSIVAGLTCGSFGRCKSWYLVFGCQCSYRTGTGGWLWWRRSRPLPNHNLRLAMWPTDTDLVFAPGTNRLMLTHQYPPVCAIMQDAFENVRAYLLFDHSFPDAISIPVAIRTCLLSATMESLNPRAVDIHGRLTKDFEYMDRLSYLVSVS